MSVQRLIYHPVREREQADQQESEKEIGRHSDTNRLTITTCALQAIGFFLGKRRTGQLSKRLLLKSNLGKVGSGASTFRQVQVDSFLNGCIFDTF
jgi:hypothetical protein